jgi:hypothetical protein
MVSFCRGRASEMSVYGNNVLIIGGGVDYAGCGDTDSNVVNDPLTV